MGKRKGEKANTLTEFEKLFIKHYDGNGAEAALKAGSKAKYPKSVAYDILRRPRVIAALAAKDKGIHKGIEKAGEREGERFAVTTSNVLKELARLAFFDARKLFNEDGSPKHITELDDDTAASVAGLDVEEVFEGRGEERSLAGVIKKWKIADKGQNLERLGKHLGMFIDRHMGLPPDFLSRSAEDQEYFCQHGCYPEDDVQRDGPRAKER